MDAKGNSNRTLKAGTFDKHSRVFASKLIGMNKHTPVANKEPDIDIPYLFLNPVAEHVERFTENTEKS